MFKKLRFPMIANKQLSITLGHASIATTERYIAAKQHFRVAPCDVLDLDISGANCGSTPANINSD